MPAHGQKSSVSSRLYDAPTSTWTHPDAFYRKYPHMRPGAPVPQGAAVPTAPGPCPVPAPVTVTVLKERPTSEDFLMYSKADVDAVTRLFATDRVAAAEEALREARQQAKENAAAERAALAAKEAADAVAATQQALRERLTHEAGLASATCLLISDVRNLLLNGHSEVRANTAYADYAYELQPLAKSYGCKLIPVGDRKQGTLVVLP